MLAQRVRMTYKLLHNFHFISQMANILEKKQMIPSFMCPTLTCPGKTPEIGEQRDVESHLFQEAFSLAHSLFSRFSGRLQTAPRNEALCYVCLLWFSHCIGCNKFGSLTRFETLPVRINLHTSYCHPKILEQLLFF